MLNNLELKKNYQIDSQSDEAEEQDTIGKLKIILLAITLIVGIVLCVLLITQNTGDAKYFGENENYSLKLTLKNNGTFVYDEKNSLQNESIILKGNYSLSDTGILHLSFYNGKELNLKINISPNGIQTISFDENYPLLRLES